jgi:hypothetical protein
MTVLTPACAGTAAEVGRHQSAGSGASSAADAVLRFTSALGFRIEDALVLLGAAVR